MSTRIQRLVRNHPVRHHLDAEILDRLRRIEDAALGSGLLSASQWREQVSDDDATELCAGDYDGFAVGGAR